MRLIATSLAFALFFGVAGIGTASGVDLNESDSGLPPEARAIMDQMERQQREQFLALRESAQPRDWAIASKIWINDDAFVEGSPAARAEMLRNAAAAAPDDALVQWIALTDMPNTSGGCGSSTLDPAAVASLLRVDDGNALAWIPVLAQAHRAGDASTVDATLARMAAAPRLDDYAGTYAAALLDAQKRHPNVTWTMPFFKEAGFTADVGATLYVLAQGTSVQPDFDALETACNANSETSADWRRFAACGDIGRRLALEGKTTNARQHGFAVLRAAGQSTDADSAQERRLAWWQSQIEVDSPDQAVASMAQLVRFWSTHHDEVKAYEQVLRARGVSLDPPPGWDPDSDEDESGDVTEPTAAEIETTLESDADSAID